MDLRKVRLFSASCKKKCGSKKLNKHRKLCSYPCRRKKPCPPRVSRIKELQKQVSALSQNLASLSAVVSQIQHDLNVLEVTVGSIVEAGQDTNLQLQARVNTFIVVGTPTDMVSGILIAVGTDYIQIQEPSGSIAIVRTTQIQYFV